MHQPHFGQTHSSGRPAIWRRQLFRRNCRIGDGAEQRVRSGKATTTVVLAGSLLVTAGLAGWIAWSGGSTATAGGREEHADQGISRSPDAPTASASPARASLADAASASSPRSPGGGSGGAAAPIPSESVATAASRTGPAPVQARIVHRDESPQAASVVEALLTGRHSERLTPSIQPAPIDANAWRADDPPRPDGYRAGYVGRIEPGRVFQSAQAGPEVPALAAIGPQALELPAWSVDAQPTVELSVIATAAAPVTFNSFDSGAFVETRLPTATVIAGDDGLARVRYYATEGTVDRVRILAASPFSSGQVEFQVQVAEQRTVTP